MGNKLLFLENSYIKTCSAIVQEILQTPKSDRIEIILDQTIFYPRGGGQPSDQGVIKSQTGEAIIQNVVLKGDSVIHEGKLKGNISVGQQAECLIDWQRRFHNMQVHSAGHVLHEAIMSLLPDLTPIEADHGRKPYMKYQGIINKILERRIKEKANELIRKDLPIFSEFVTLAELEKRVSWVPSHLPKNKPLRIIWIGDFPPIPDGGTQVKSTSEISLFSQIIVTYENENTFVHYKMDFPIEKTVVEPSPSLISGIDKAKLQNLKNEALAMIMQTQDQAELENIRIQYLGKSGQLAQIAGQLKSLEPAERTEIGKLFNDVKSAIQASLDPKLKIENLKLIIEGDPTLPGLKPRLGHLHPISQAIEEISIVFEKIGFIRVRYPETDWDWYTFESLNMTPDHPARDEWETFFVDAPPHPKLGQIVLTPHTSNGQVREMERVKKPPIRMINIAKCYRRQSDVSHTVMFHQFEGLVIDTGITIAHLKGTIDYFVHQFFGPDRKSRLRPSHFQFTEPSFEVDVTCDICLGQGCRLCKEGWLELGGAGMVHPSVLSAGKIDPQKYTGFAFGWGVERTYMMKSGLKIPDLRLLYSNDIRFLNQF